jgi:hypothetical protein
MSAEIAHELHERTIARPLRARIVLALGPLAMIAGFAWALAQPYRITLLHPSGEGFWWLVGGESPLYVALAGLLFWRVVAVPLAKDVDAAG